MRSILQKKSLRFIFAANVISMIGSGMNSAAVAWYILQATHSEIALGTFAVVQTLPAILLLPFTGVIIDREDRRRLVMALDVTRAVVIAVVAVLAFEGDEFRTSGLVALADDYSIQSRAHICTSIALQGPQQIRSGNYVSPSGVRPG